MDGGWPLLGDQRRRVRRHVTRFQPVRRNNINPVADLQLKHVHGPEKDSILFVSRVFLWAVCPGVCRLLVQRLSTNMDNRAHLLAGTGREATADNP